MTDPNHKLDRLIESLPHREPERDLVRGALDRMPSTSAPITWLKPALAGVAVVLLLSCLVWMREPDVGVPLEPDLVSLPSWRGQITDLNRQIEEPRKPVFAGRAVSVRRSGYRAPPSRIERLHERAKRLNRRIARYEIEEETQRTKERSEV